MRKSILKSSLIAMLGVVTCGNDFMNVNATECDPFNEDSIEYAIIKNDFGKFVALSSDESLLKKKVRFKAKEIGLFAFAALVGNKDVFNHLLVNGFEITNDVINLAVAGGNTEIIEIIRQKGYSFENCMEYVRDLNFASWLYEEYDTDRGMYYVIMNNIRDGNLEMSLNCLKEFKSNLNLDNLKRLVCKFARILAVDSIGGLLEIIQDDLKSNPDLALGPVIRLAYDGNMQLLRFLIEEYKVDVNIQDNGGQTPLHIASLKGNLDMVKYLIKECKANPNIKDNDGWSPLYFASLKGNLDMVKYLIKECKADPDIKDNDGLTPLHIASLKGNLDMVKYLIEECKADPDIKDNDGWSPLYIASDRGHSDIVRYLNK